MALCDFCFRDKSPLQPIYPRVAVNVCKACAYQIDRVIGFLRHSGITLVAQTEFTTAEKPPKPPKVSKALRSKISPSKATE
ncbi:hypothetical protein ES703_108077 [subsurface metagenome]